MCDVTPLVVLLMNDSLARTHPARSWRQVDERHKANVRKGIVTTKESKHKHVRYQLLPLRSIIFHSAKLLQRVPRRISRCLCDKSFAANERETATTNRRRASLCRSKFAVKHSQEGSFLICFAGSYLESVKHRESINRVWDFI